jgi:hypothetical protein
MMKKLFIVLTVSICGLTAIAQKKDAKETPSFSRFVLSINGGISSPTGSFSKGDYADEKSGFASTGGNFNITGTYYLSKHFGIGALVGYSSFGSKGAQSLSDGYKEDSGTDSTTLYKKGSNHSFSVLVGPYYQIISCKKLSLNVHVLGGYTNTHLAGFQIFYEDYLDNAMSQREASGGAFGLQAGLGVQYHITPKLSVQVTGDYFTSKPNIAISYDNFIVNSGRKLSSYNESISGINATVGIAYALF